MATKLMRSIVAITAGVAIGAGALVAFQAGAQQPAGGQAAKQSLGPSDFNPIQVAPPFPPITKFPVVPAGEVGRRVDDAELVLGVQWSGESRAYPINMLTGPRREILNDELAGRAIAATW